MSGPDDPGEEVDADELDEELVDELVGGGGGGDEREHRFVAEAADAGGRLDAVVAARVAALSRAQVQRLIEDGQVTVGGVVAKKAGARLKVGEDIAIRIPAPSTLEVVAQDVSARDPSRGRGLIVIDKPAGLVVTAPGPPRARWSTRCCS
ncbi:MAG: hypothetical protein IPQ07_34425 [Myxococcales bacterium]|nr:hypothetical protein [Myxococcales bacterium]